MHHNKCNLWFGFYMIIGWGQSVRGILINYL